MEQEGNQETNLKSETVKVEDPVEVSLRFNIDVREGDMEVRWLQGIDSILFESFCGMLKRAMKQK
jgi:23S rRNA (adenine1618-N6)-methyltransferase